MSEQPNFFIIHHRKMPHLDDFYLGETICMPKRITNVIRFMMNRMDLPMYRLFYYGNHIPEDTKGLPAHIAAMRGADGQVVCTAQ